MVTDFILVRHGETDYNKNRIIQGWEDIPLNKTGYQQAAVTAEMLRNESFEEAWFSDLQRASETAKAVLKYHPGVPAYPDPLLREWKLGIIQNKSYPELERDYPEYEEMLRTESMELAVPGGESRNEFQKRINQAFQEFAEHCPGKRVLIVTHGGVLVRLYRFLGGEVPPEGRVPVPGNASVSKVRFDHKTGKWSILVWDQRYSPDTADAAAPPVL